MVNWQMYKNNAEVVGALLDRLMNYLPIILGVGIFLEIFGALLVLFGVNITLGAFCLLTYLTFATLLYFPFWFYEGEQMIHNLTLFLKNIALLGGCLLLFKGKVASFVNISGPEDG
jgi:uncharacterized membrane protein YphA (DoxX/SURF4 family)